MKKHFIKTLFFVLAIVTTFSLVACSEEYEKARDNLYAYVEAGEFKAVSQGGSPLLFLVTVDDINEDGNIQSSIVHIFGVAKFYVYTSKGYIYYFDILVISEDYELVGGNIIYENIIYERK